MKEGYVSWRVLVTARAFWVSGAAAREALLGAGCEVIQSPEPGPLPVTVMIPLLRDCDAVIASSDPYTAELFDACPRVKVISRCGVGYDSIDLPAATAAGIVAAITPGAMNEAVGDYTWALLLALARHVPEGDALMKSGGWGEYPGALVCGKTLGIVGLGGIGREVARRAAGFSMRLLAFDPALRRENLPEYLRHVDLVSLDRLLAESDFVSLNAPNLPETRRMFNDERFARMKRTAYFINTARGALVDEPALIRALENGIIAGAAVDVYTEEPLPADDPLRRAPRILLTPHNAFNAVEAAAEMSRLSALNVLAVMRGERPPGLLNPEVLESAQRR